jgi:hypothetical protein
MRRSLGEGWRFGRRVFRGFVAVEAVPAYSKRTEGHGELNLMLYGGINQTSCGAAELEDAGRYGGSHRGSPRRV